MAKDIYFGNEMRRKVYTGAHKVAQAVVQTLGPAGRTVIIDNGANPTISKDGVSVAKQIDLADPVENLGASLIKNISSATDTAAGDGTTTAACLSLAILAEGLKAIDNGVNPIKVRRGIDEAVKDIVSALKEVTQPVETEEQIKQVASISANNDPIIGGLIAQAISTVGNAGVVTTAESNTAETYMEFVEGMSFDNGYISPYFSTDHENLTVEYTKPYILMTDKAITNINALVPMLEAVMREGAPLLILTENVEGEALSTLIVNSLRGVMKVCAVKAPGFGDRRKDMLEDIAILTGGQVITDTLGKKLETATLLDLGRAETVKVTKDTTTIVGGMGDSAEIEARVKRLEKDIEEATSDYDKEKLQERLARLAGGVALIKVGDTTEAALKEKKFRIEDALNATRAAIEEGIVSGGGVALAQCKPATQEKADWTADNQVGYDIVMKAIKEPLKQIAENAGVSGDVVLDKVINSEVGTGYNALTGEYVNMVAAGIVDPVKITKSALINAASVASLILTSSASITTALEKKDNCNCGPIAGMTPIG